MTPNDIEILIHYYSSLRHHPRLDAPAVSGAIDDFMMRGLLISNSSNSGYEVTDLGRAHIAQLCNLPIPTIAYIDGNNKVIKGV